MLLNAIVVVLIVVVVRVSEVVEAVVDVEVETFTKASTTSRSEHHLKVTIASYVTGVVERVTPSGTVQALLTLDSVRTPKAWPHH